MRRKPNKELYSFLKTNALSNTIDELLPTVNGMVDVPYTRLQLQKYLVRNRIPYKYSNPKMIRNMNRIPIGTERISEGRVQIKIAKNKWIYKTRYLYEQYHHVTLTDNDFIFQLDRNPNNFDIDNLIKISRYEGSHLRNYTFVSEQPIYNMTILDLVKLKVKIKDK